MRLIDANEAIEKINCLCVDGNENWIGTDNRSFVDHADVIDILSDMSTVDAEPVKHAAWVCVNEEANVWMCTGKDGCGNELILLESTPKFNGWDYCPYCGAKMDGDGNGT